MRITLRSLLAVLALGIVNPMARAADITFDLTQLAGGAPSSSLTVDGYTLLFTATNGNLNTSSNASTGGVSIYSIQSFTIQKTAGAADLIFKTYSTGDVVSFSGSTLSFNLTGGTGTSDGNALSAQSSYAYSGNYILVGSQTVTFSPINFSFLNIGLFVYDYANIRTLTFTPVPEPSSYALGGLATGVMAFVARRRKASRQG